MFISVVKYIKEEQTNFKEKYDELFEEFKKTRDCQFCGSQRCNRDYEMSDECVAFQDYRNAIPLEFKVRYNIEKLLKGKHVTVEFDKDLSDEEIAESVSFKDFNKSMNLGDNSSSPQRL